jgi:hypothetical protein
MKVKNPNNTKAVGEPPKISYNPRFVAYRKIYSAFIFGHRIYDPYSGCYTNK